MKYIELDEDMEMPCQCDCGNWFDLHSGFRDRHSNKVVCEDCHEKEQEIKKIEDEIYDLELIGNKKREVNKLKKQLKTLQ